MERMDKVLSYEKTETDIIFEYKKDGEKYKVTTPLYLKDGSKNPRAEEYLDLYRSEKIKDLKSCRIHGGIVLAAGVFLAAISAHRNYKLCTEPNYVVEHYDESTMLALGGYAAGTFTMLGSIVVSVSNNEIKKLKKSRK